MSFGQARFKPALLKAFDARQPGVRTLPCPVATLAFPYLRSIIIFFFSKQYIRESSKYMYVIFRPHRRTKSRDMFVIQRSHCTLFLRDVFFKKAY